MPSALSLFFWIAIAVALGTVSNKMRRGEGAVCISLLFVAFALSLSWTEIVVQTTLAACLTTFFGAAFGSSVLGAIIVIGPFLAGRYLVRAVFVVSRGRYGGDR